MSLLKAIVSRKMLMHYALRPNCVYVSTQSSKKSLRSEAVEESKQFMERNEQLKRPISPFLNYKIQLTNGLSFTHRCTGLALSVLVYGWGISEIFAKTNFAHQLAWIQSTVPGSFLATIKLLTITSFGFHLFNGIRHLAWDVGIGFSLRELYLSGYIVVALTAVVAAMAFMYY